MVDINANDAFKKIYITSGRATLKVGDAVSNFDLNEVFFGNGGGKLDINGNVLNVKNISANDKNANIINSNSNQASLTIKGNDGADTIVHASIGGTQNNKINLIADPSSHNLVFNSDVDIDGSFKATNSKITLQGHPTTHATRTPTVEISTIKQYDKTIPAYMDLDRPSTLTQPDWDGMKFKTSSVELTNSELNVGKKS
ncbi:MULTISPECIES: S6 family peptidase [Campylobacter]|uniref:S6 family peptidase n=1 Tax=Campylobacter TaxID=194 RepID=UPI001473E454|nr:MULTISPECIES: S6 family peptidase [unclassified Campylobacter]MBE3609970.1 hypothetical protein [Campylobacter sp. RM12916]